MTRWGLFSVVFVWLCEAMAGCGGCGDSRPGHLPDAPSDDVMVIEEPPLQVTVTVTRGGSPLMDRPVYFQAADSTVVAEAMTSLGGQASAIMDAGGFVTVIESEEVLSGETTVTQAKISTFAGVRPGDELHLDLSPPEVTGDPVAFNLTFPIEQASDVYTLYSSCGTVSLDVIETLTRPATVGPRTFAAATRRVPVSLQGCGGTADMLVVRSAFQSEDPEPRIVGWLYVPNQAIAADAEVTLDGDYMPPMATSFTYTNVPSAVDSFAVHRELRSPRGLLFTSATGTAQVDKASSSATVTIDLPTPPNVLAITTTTDQPTFGHGLHTFVAWGPSASGPVSLDYSEAALRRYDELASYDPAMHAIGWTVAAGGVDPSFVLGRILAQRSDGEAGRHEWAWRIVAPYVAGSPKLVYPKLPTTTIYDYNVGENDSPAVDQLTTLRVPGGYEAARPHAFANPPVELLGATGRIVLEDLFTPPDPGLTGTTSAPSRRLSRERFTPRVR